MFDEFATAAATADIWAQRKELTEHSRRLARIISWQAAKLARSMFLNSSEVACFETIGCHLCWRVGERRCEDQQLEEVVCPLGMDKVKALDCESKTT